MWVYIFADLPLEAPRSPDKGLFLLHAYKTMRGRVKTLLRAVMKCQGSPSATA